MNKFEGPISNITLATGDKFGVPMSRDDVVSRLRTMGPICEFDDLYGSKKAVNPEHVALVEQIQPGPAA